MTNARGRRFARGLGILALVMVMTGCAKAAPPASCEQLAALDPSRAETAARADLQAGRARYMAVYGRYAVDAPGAPPDLAGDPAILEDALADGPCGHLYPRAVDYARRYNETLTRLRGEPAAP